jgi:hypothetical protein
VSTAPNPLYFLIGFPLFWFAVTLLLSSLSGWFGLMERYPDHREAALSVFANQSGSMGAVSMRGILEGTVAFSHGTGEALPFTYQARAISKGTQTPMTLRRRKPCKIRRPYLRGIKTCGCGQ